MMKSLFESVDWRKIQVVGFDMDGTLYDEHQFIKQVYKPISELLSKHCSVDSKDMYRWLDQRWLEKGSSYPFIYSEALERFNGSFEKEDGILKECINIYRSYKPSLELDEHVQTFLNELAREFPLFLITDGSFQLQSSKFDTLGLERWFVKENVGFTGFYGSGYYKPSTKVIQHIAILQDVEPSEIIYFGDRDVDKQFADQANYKFIQVKGMRGMNS